MTSKITIRPYRSEDWLAICRVHDRSRPDELRGSFDARAFIPLAEDPERGYIQDCDMFVAQQAETIIGFAGIDDPYLAWLYVDPTFYRQGVGQALLQHCTARLSDEAWTNVCGNNTAAISMYLRAGFVVESRFSGENAGYKGASARMALHLHRRGWTRPKKSETSSQAS